MGNRPFPMTNPDKSGAKGGAGQVTPDMMDYMSPVKGQPDGWEVDGTKGRNHDVPGVNGTYAKSPQSTGNISFPPPCVSSEVSNNTEIQRNLNRSSKGADPNIGLVGV